MRAERIQGSSAEDEVCTSIDDRFDRLCGIADNIISFVLLKDSRFLLFQDMNSEE